MKTFSYCGRRIDELRTPARTELPPSFEQWLNTRAANISQEHEVYRALVERTWDALARLGEQRAIGRVESAIAILVGMQVMDRQSARQKAEAFKSRVRNPGKQSD